MKNPKQLITLAAVVAMCGVLLASCGGGSGSSASKTEVINGITVPPEPDATLNAATLAGVDSNSNGVRDDVERKVAALSTNETQFQNAIALAKAYHQIIDNPPPSDRNIGLSLEKTILCATKNSDDLPNKLNGYSDTNLEAFIFNTEDRKSKLHDLRAVVGGYDSDEVNCND